MLQILYEDAHCLAVNKPAGLLIQGRHPGDETLEMAVRRHLDRDLPTTVYLGIVHRLDRPVSGVVLWAKNPKAARRLAEQFANRETVKEYRAAVSPIPTIPSGVWEDWLDERDAGMGRVLICQKDTPQARLAVTRFVVGVCPTRPTVALLMLQPETGRTHQLRVQSSSRGWPILGDLRYGSTEPFPNGIALHAASLTVKHPTTGATMTISADLPESWNQAGVFSSFQFRES